MFACEQACVLAAQAVMRPIHPDSLSFVEGRGDFNHYFITLAKKMYKRLIYQEIKIINAIYGNKRSHNGHSVLFRKDKKRYG